MRSAIAKKSTVEGEWRPVYKDREGAWTLLLNKDPESHARTLAVKYAKGFEVLESLHDGTVEVLVLEGQWQVGRNRLRPRGLLLRARRRHARPRARAHRRPHPGHLARAADSGTVIHPSPNSLPLMRGEGPKAFPRPRRERGSG